VGHQHHDAPLVVGDGPHVCDVICRVVPPLIGSSVAPRVADCRDLRDSFRVEQGVQDRVIQWHVEYRVRALRQHLAKLLHPVLPRVVAPGVVDPEESTLLQITPQRSGFLRCDECPAELAHHHKRAFEELVFRRLNDDVIGIA
jgi:hypothetical protein